MLQPRRQRERSATWRFERFTYGVAAGVVAAGVGLGAAELTTAASGRLQSPVIDVGDRVVDGVPNWLKTQAIEWFGQNDKRALLIGIGVVLGLYAAALGVVALTRRWPVALAGAAAFGLAGAYASQSSRRPAPWWAIAPSLVGGVVAAATLALLRWVFLHRAGRSGWAGSEQLDRVAGGVDRRLFLAATGGAATVAVVANVVGRELVARRSVAAESRTLDLPAADRALAGAATPSGVQVAGAVPFVTPNVDFYRIDTALTVPQVSIDGWELAITGMVDRELRLSFDDLLDRPIVEADITLACVSNEIGGSLIGNARWLGVRLDDLLAEAGIDPAADQIVGRSVDGFTAGFPVAALDGRAALVAIGMNDEPLPVEHGYPARLIVPGLYGYVSATKWLTGIELSRFDAFDAYWVDRGWAADGPIKLQSRIDTPRGLATVARGTVPVAGVAWAQTRGIDAVELQFDDAAWVPAELAGELNVDTWRQWSYAWNATPGRHTIRVRAIERGGAIQTADRSEPFPSGATGQHQIVVLVE